MTQCDLTHLRIFSRTADLFGMVGSDIARNRFIDSVIMANALQQFVLLPSKQVGMRPVADSAHALIRRFF